MIHDDPIPPPKETGWAEYIVFTAITAAATALVTGLMTWTVDELRAKYGSAKAETKKETT